MVYSFMSANCLECRFGELNFCLVKKVFIDQRGKMVKEESVGNQSLIICRPPGTRSGFPYRNSIAPLGYCGNGEKK
jgi:hypothetical protein